LKHAKRLSLTLAAAIVALLAAGAHTASPDSSKQVMAYLEGGKASYESLTAFYTYVNQLPADTFAVDIHGAIKGTAPAQALDFAKSKGIATFATVSNFDAIGFDAKITHAILNNSKPRVRAINQMLKLVQRWGYQGINIDLESIDHSDRKAFSSFVSDVARKMRSGGYLTVVSVPAELKDDPQDSWTGAFDLAALGQSADILQVMTYDQHGPWGAPGPVAGLNWVEPCIAYSASVVTPSKLSLGIPAYGYDWNQTAKTGAQVFWKDIPALIAKSGAKPQWDSTSSSPFFTYQAADGSSHVVWYEDEKSIPLKSALATTYKLAGVSVFALGYDDLSFWQAIRLGGL
jgi:spore germination protein YaaH